MKRSRSQSSAERSSSVDDESSDSSNTETSASYDLHESEESSPPPSAPVRAKPESKDRDNYAKRSSSDKASIVPKKVKDENTSHSIRKKVHPSASHNKSKPSKERKSNHTSKPKVIEVIDSSASEYNPSDEDDGSESSSCSENESETQTRQPEKPAYKIPKNEIKHDPESVPAIKKVKARPEATLKKHTSRETKSEGSKEISRFSRGECLLRSVM